MTELTLSTKPSKSLWNRFTSMTVLSRHNFWSPVHSPGAAYRTVDGFLAGAEVGGDDLRVLEHLFGRAPGDDRSLLQGHQLRGDGEEQRHVVLDDQHRGTGLLLDPAQQ